MHGMLAGKRVLVVEDEYFIAADIRRALTSESAEVLGPVGRLAEGLAFADTAQVEAAVLDINLHGETSYAIADALAEKDIPFLFVTGYDGWSVPSRFGDTPRIAKPFAATRVTAAVVDLLDPAAVGHRT